jgi:hypothetical protein
MHRADVLQCPWGEWMEPDSVVTRLAALLEQLPEFTEGDAYAAMETAGIDAAQADRAYKFTQIVCGRSLLSGLDVTLSDDYLCLNAAGETVESGKLATEPFYLAATVLIAHSPRPPWVARMGAMSADVATVNDLLKRGSKPADLVMSSSMLFLENPTPAGMAAATRLIAGQLQRFQPSPPKRWWQFWSS